MSGTNGGERHADTDLDPSKIERALAQRQARIGLPLVVQGATVSTNDDAKRAAQAGAPEGAAFVADAQASGRGRLGRTWHSPPGSNLYVSFVLRPTLTTERLGWVSLAAGLAVVDAVGPRVAQVAGTARLGIKWPNDVLLDGRKLAGVLSEAEIVDHKARAVIVGIGINVRTSVFPPDLAGTATSLALAGVADLDRSTLLVDLSLALATRIDALEHGETSALHADLRRLDVLAGKMITVAGMRGCAVGIGPQGWLHVVGPDGEERAFGSGEATVEARTAP